MTKTKFSTWVQITLRASSLLLPGTITFAQTATSTHVALYTWGTLQRAKKRCLDTPLVFPNSTGTRPVSVREAFEWAVKYAEIAEVLGHKTLG